MRFFSLLTAIACAALGVACSSSNDTSPGSHDAGNDGDAQSCALPAGLVCCHGDVLGSFTCNASGAAVCDQGTQLTPENECRTPPPHVDAGPDADAQSCALPAGLVCCHGDVLGSFTCNASGAAVCDQGTQLTPENECRTPPPHIDAGPDADAQSCALPAGQLCCDGDVLGSFTCDANGHVLCSAGTHLTPENQCTLPPPHDAGSDAGH